MELRVLRWLHATEGQSRPERLSAIRIRPLLLSIGLSYSSLRIQSRVYLHLCFVLLSKAFTAQDAQAKLSLVGININD